MQVAFLGDDEASYKLARLREVVNHAHGTGDSRKE